LKIEKEGQSVNETSPLLTRDDFQLTLQQSLLKISQFYTEQEAQSYSELDTLLLSPMVDSGGFMLFQEDKKMNLVETDSSSTSGSTVMEEEEGTRYHTIHVSDRQRAIDLRQRLFNLKSFVDLNLIGYSKIINHYDRLQSKDVGRLVLLSYPFKPSTQTRLQSLIKQVEDLVQQLDPQESANVQCNTADGQSSWLCKKSCIDLAFLAISLAVFVCLLNAELFENIEQTYCFAILVFAIILWATEVRSRSFFFFFFFTFKKKNYNTLMHHLFVY
jgi:phosphate transporter